MTGTALSAVRRASLPVLLLCAALLGARAPLAQESPAEADPWTELDGFHDNAEDQPVFKALELARESIDIEIYEMSDPDVRAALRTALGRKPEPIRIRVIKDPDPLGEKCRYFEPASDEDDADCQDQKRLVAEVRASPGGAFAPFNKAELCGGRTKKGGPRKCFEHGKLVIIDRKHALLSTGNFNSSNLCNRRRNPRVCNRDFSYVTSDPEVVGTLAKIFAGDLAQKKYDLEALLTSGVRKKLTVSPYSLQPLLDFIGRAKKSIRIENQYLKEKEINDALKAKAQERVEIHPMVSSLCSFGRPKGRQASGELFQGFGEAGIQFRFFTSSMKVGGRSGYLHAKAIVVDDASAWVGSVNGSETATSANREFGIFFDKPADVKRLAAILDADYADPQSETWTESVACAKDHPATEEVAGEAPPRE